MDTNEKLRRLAIRQQAVIDYELTEGMLTIDENGRYAHCTPEMLGIDEQEIFSGLEEVLAEISRY